MRMLRPWHAPRWRLKRQIVGQRLGDEGSRSAPRLQIPFGEQLLVREQGRGARDTQVVGERTRGGEPRAGFQDAVEHGPPHRPVDLPLQPFGPPHVDVNHQPRG
jgi:hypothetical protein